MKRSLRRYCVLLVAIFFLLPLLYDGERPSTLPKPVIGNVDNLRNAYERWKAAVTAAGQASKLVLPLGYSKGLSSKHTRAHGQATLDLVRGALAIEVVGLPERDAWDVWLVDNRPGVGASVLAEPGDGFLHLGRLVHKEGQAATLRGRLEPAQMEAFKLDLLMVAKAGDPLKTARVLFGSPTLFQRLYYAELRGEPYRVGTDRNQEQLAHPVLAPLLGLIPAPAYAAEPAELEELIAKGEDLFFNRTFKGNGRTCGTCHPKENNFTLDPAFIATIPDTDPLFVADPDKAAFNPDLANLEKPEMMEMFGLILENLDGFEDLDDDGNPDKFVMRAVQHTLALPTSITPVTNIPPGGPQGPAPANMTGWSGDGSPNTGSMRDFIIGAVMQHYPKTLARVPGVDFKLPNDKQLDALEAFQLSLGRQIDLDLANLVLSNAAAADGQDIFVNGTGVPATPGSCNACHNNAGAGFATAGDENRNFNTGIEDRLDSPTISPTAMALGVPRDGGFGKLDVAPSIGDGAFGNDTFNTQVVVEAADTAPLFHTNVAPDIEAAVRHYTLPEFNNRVPLSFRIALDETQITQVGTFLRVINAVENIRSARQFASTALEISSFVVVPQPLSLALEEIGDARRVLEDKLLHTLDAVPELESAETLLDQARGEADETARNGLIDSAIIDLDEARAFMVTSG